MFNAYHQHHDAIFAVWGVDYIGNNVCKGTREGDRRKQPAIHMGRYRRRRLLSRRPLRQFLHNPMPILGVYLSRLSSEDTATRRPNPVFVAHCPASPKRTELPPAVCYYTVVTWLGRER